MSVAVSHLSRHSVVLIVDKIDFAADFAITISVRKGVHVALSLLGVVVQGAGEEGRRGWADGLVRV